VTDAATPPATASAPPEAPSRERLALTATLLAVLLVWVSALGCGFTIWDDGAYVLWNADVARLDLAHVLDPATQVLGDWTPLATVTYWAERALLGTEPWVPHATNVALHVAAVWLVQRLCRDVGFGVWTSCGVALVFGVHPLQAESVVWISARKDVLVTVFALAFLRAFLARRNLSASVWLLLALTSKATAVGLPVVAAAAELLGLRAPPEGAAPAESPPRRTRVAAWLWIAAWLVPCALRGWLSVEAQAGTISRTAAIGFGGRMSVMGAVLTTQARQVLWPEGLSVLYDPPQRGWSDPVLLAQWTCLAALAALAVLLARRDRGLAWTGVLALAMAAPTLNVFPGPVFQADRYLRLPLVAIAAFLVAALTPLARVKTCVPVAVLLAWTGAVLVPATLRREAVWTDHESLFLDTVRKTPGSAIAWNQLGLGRMERGDPAGAAEAYARARMIDPRDPFVAHNMAVALLAQGRNAEAEMIARELIGRDPRNGEARAMLGLLAARAGRRDDAEREFAEALRLAPRSTIVRKWLDDFRTGR
jgi:protein O-mannosyl-transferase